MFVACTGTLWLVLISFRYVMFTVGSVILLNTSVHFTAQELCSLVLPNTFGSVELLNTFSQLYCSILQFTLRRKSCVHLYCLILLGQLHCSIPFFSYIAQYFSSLYGTRVVFTCPA